MEKREAYHSDYYFTGNHWCIGASYYDLPAIRNVKRDYWHYRD